MPAETAASIESVAVVGDKNEIVIAPFLRLFTWAGVSG